MSDTDATDSQNTSPTEDAARTTATHRAGVLRTLHAGPDLLVLPNAWDVATARAVVGAGYAAVATSSGAVAGSLGYGDHEQAPADEMLAAAARIARAVDVPVTADVESGYGWVPAELVDRLTTAGIAGCNLEDTDHSTGELRAAGEQAEYLRSVRDALDAAGADLVLNARVDTFLHPDDPTRQLEAGIERARAYADAGADCVYPIVLTDADALRTFVDALRPTPVNALLLPATPAFAVLREIGVRRVSLGGGMFRAVQRVVGELATGVATGETARLFRS
jgi:2-methylisocitrate lyase-like PEP mutase family enzyme